MFPSRPCNERADTSCPMDMTRERDGWMNRSLSVVPGVALAMGLSAAAAMAQNIGVGSRGSGPSANRRILEAAALRIEGSAPTIDGRLDERIWQAASPMSDFVQFRPDPGRPATATTEARILLDDDAVYVGMRMYDSPDSIAAQLTRRDATGAFTDWAHVLIDSYHDRRTAFRFSITPRGAKKDVLHFNDGQEDVNWDAVWDGAAHSDEQGWTAEMRIPLSQLRFTRGDGDAMVWGINVGREIARKDRDLIGRLWSFDAVVVAGQAKSHCVAWTVEDLLNAALQKDPRLASRIYLLEDCTSSVVVPGVIDYTEQADAAYRRFAAAGMHVVRSTDLVSDW